MEAHIRNLPVTTIRQIIRLLTIIADYSRDICANNPNSIMNANFRETFRQLMQIIPDLIHSTPDFGKLSDDPGGPWCDMAYNYRKLLEKIVLIYRTFGANRVEQGFALTPGRTANLLETQPAILYQPGGYATRLFQQQAHPFWANQ